MFKKTLYLFFHYRLSLCITDIYLYLVITMRHYGRRKGQRLPPRKFNYFNYCLLPVGFIYRQSAIEFKILYYSRCFLLPKISLEMTVLLYIQYTIRLDEYNIRMFDVLSMYKYKIHITSIMDYLSLNVILSLCTIASSILCYFRHTIINSYYYFVRVCCKFCIYLQYCPGL